MNLHTVAYGTYATVWSVSRERTIDREHWVRAALEGLGAEGEAGVAVEPLARRLGVTKGSFYWHFSGRDALWSAVLETYERVATKEPIAALSGLAEPRARLRGLFSLAFDSPEHLRAERALFASTRADVRRVVASVHDRRRAFLEACYAELGLDTREAAAWASTTYAAFCGAVLLADREPFASEGSLAAWVAHLAQVVIPERGT